MTHALPSTHLCLNTAFNGCRLLDDSSEGPQSRHEDRRGGMPARPVVAKWRRSRKQMILTHHGTVEERTISQTADMAPPQERRAERGMESHMSSSTR